MKTASSFIGRAPERDALNGRWRSASAEFLVLYGRRRVGKTELLRRFAEGKRALFAVGSRSDARSQIRHFLGELERVGGEAGVSGLPIHDWDTALGRLSAHLKRSRGKTLVILDEFQWMAEASPELPSLLQKWWDAEWSRNGKIFLVLCGSYVGFMEREVLGRRSPLFGRRTAVLHLKPLSFSESRLFHPGLSLKEQVKRHLLCGGIPAYHKLFTSPDGLPGQLTTAFFTPDAPLAKEADFLLMEELKAPRLYFGLLESLGAVRKGMTELAESLGVDRSRIPYYLKTLMDLGYVEKVQPLLHYKSRPERKSLYRIHDPLLRFWFTFVYPHLNTLERLDPRLFYATVVAPQLEAYWGHGFESLAAELFLTRQILPTLSEPFKMGSYWDKDTQIDFTLALASGLSYLGEVKWGVLDISTARAFLKKVEAIKEKVSARPVLISAEPLPAALRKREEFQAYALGDLVIG
jgi:AAA+ ATPase superfamily predicted ATPase